jgi:hypothetical protein
MVTLDGWCVLKKCWPRFLEGKQMSSDTGWTSSPPTKPGANFHRNNGRQSLYEVGKWPGGGLCVIVDGSPEMVEDIGGEWFAVPSPEEITTAIKCGIDLQFQIDRLRAENTDLRARLEALEKR